MTESEFNSKMIRDYVVFFVLGMSLIIFCAVMGGKSKKPHTVATTHIEELQILQDDRDLWVVKYNYVYKQLLASEKELFKITGERDTLLFWIEENTKYQKEK